MSFFNESFCLAICFLIFLYFAYRPIKASIVKALNARIELIKAQLLEAQSLKNDAELLLNKTEQQLNQLPSIREKMMLERHCWICMLIPHYLCQINYYLKNI